jgi:fibro-slime domain-containing protein/RHS repeat-associated protein
MENYIMKAKYSAIILFFIFSLIAANSAYGCFPTAILQAEPSTVKLGDSVTLDGTDSYTVSGTSITKCEWDYDYDPNTGFEPNYTEYPPDKKKVDHIYDSKGIHTAALRVTNSLNNTDIDICTVLVEAPVYNETQEKWYGYIQAAIDEAKDFDVIRVDPGMYSGNINLADVNVTIRSTDPNDWAAVGATVIHANDANFAAVTIAGSQNGNTMLAGFTISGGLCGIECNNTSPVIRNCIIKDNGQTDHPGGGIYNCNGASPLITNCFIVDNDANKGAGIYNVDSSPTIRNCVISRNAAVYDGGGLYDVNSNPIILNCTFTDNDANNGGGMYCTGSSSEPNLVSCIFWDNNAVTDGNQIYNDGADPNFKYCDIQDSGGSSYWDSNLGNNDGGNIDAYPLFTDIAEPSLDGLVSLWKFDEGTGSTAYDSIGGINGTIHGAQWVGGVIGVALQFDGYSDYVSLPTTVINGTEFTVAAWANHFGPGGGTNEDNPIFQQRDAGLSSTIALFADKNALSRVLAMIRSHNWGPDEQSISYTMPEHNQWHHYAMTVDANEFNLYIDDEKVAGTANLQTGNYVTSIDYVQIARSSYASQHQGYFNGVIDDVRIYDKALSAVEIGTIYEYGLISQYKYHLDYNSPCINSGDPNADMSETGTKDISNSGRIKGGRIDIGAYEGGKTIYVDCRADPNGDGTSWTNAFNYLQDALSDANAGDEIWVADGNYYPDENSADPNGTNDRNSTFQLVENVAVYGGFAGYETSLSQRNFKANKAVLSGDIDYDNSGTDNGLPHSGNAYHVVTGADNARIDGFIIRGGYADGSGTAQYGGGMYNDADGLEILNCHFFANYAQSNGGGIYNDALGNLKLVNCLISGNAAENIYSGRGGAVYNDAGGIELINCTISNNIAYATGGVYNNDSDDVVFKNCILWDNRDNSNITPGLLQQITDAGDGLSAATYSCIQDGNAFDDSVPYGADSNNIDSYPEFVDPGHWDAVSAPNTVIFQATVRDIQGYDSGLDCAHPDFENVMGSEANIVGPLLSELVDGKPVYAYGENPPTGSTTHGESWFYHWYHDTEYNLTTTINLETTYDESTGRYEFRDDHFFPIDDALFDSSGSNMYQCDANPKHYHNFHFTLELHTKFYYDGFDRDVKIYKADDDLWMYIDNKLIVDIGGVHSPEARYLKIENGGIRFYEDEDCTIPDSNWIDVNLVSGNTYNFDLFYAERHTVKSHLEFSTTLPLEPNLVSGDYRLREGSPCIDAGDNSVMPSSVRTDLDGYCRFVDDPNTEPNGTATVDMGAYEYQAIVAEDDEYSVAKDNVLNISAPGVLGNDYDLYGDTLECVLDTDVSSGLLILDANGAFSYTPEPNFTGTDSFTYKARGIYTSRESEAALVTINVQQSNQAPTACNDNVTTMYMTAVDINVLDNDDDPDTGDTLSILSIEQEPLHGTAVINGNYITYTPFALFGGQDSFTYVTQDNSGLPSNEATVTIMVDWVKVEAGNYEPIKWPVNFVKLRGQIIADSLGRIDTYTWSVASVETGRTVDFDPSTEGLQQTSDSLTPTVEFSWAGNYALRLTAKDKFGQVLDTDDALIVVTRSPDPNGNLPPIVDAGEYDAVELPNKLELDGTVTDDGYPYGLLDIHWLMDYGPAGATVTFEDPYSEDTDAVFSRPGPYRLQLWASDGYYDSNDYVDVNVIGGSQYNEPPYVNAGANQWIEPLSTTYIQTSLDGTVFDDGKPIPPGKVSLEWSVILSPFDASVIFEPNEFVEDPCVTFNRAGLYILRLDAGDGQYDVNGVVQIDINQPVSLLEVDAGPNQVVILPDYADLNGVVLSGTADSNEWSLLNGPAPVDFENPSALKTKAGFVKAGLYVLQLKVTDGLVEATDQMTVKVLPGIKLSGGEDHTLILLEDMTVWACGENGKGQLGDGTSSDRSIVVPVLNGDMNTASGRLENIKSVAAGWNHSLALDANGHVWAWGDNYYGELGQNNQDDSYTPVQVLSGDQPGGQFLSDIVFIASGRSGEHSLAVDVNGYVWSWGRGNYGELGDGVSGGNHCQLAPVQVLSGEQDPCDANSFLENIIAVSGGAYHSMALEANGHVWTWGNDSWEQLGNGPYPNSNEPVRVLSGQQDGNSLSTTPLENIVAVSAGWFHSMALEKLDANDPNCRGRVYTWGDNGDGWVGKGCWGGRLGNGQWYGAQFVPIMVLSGDQDPNNPDSVLENIIVISAGESHCMALDVNGNVWTWGDNSLCQLGNGMSYWDERWLTPVKVVALNEPNYGSDYLEDIVAISAGYWHCLAMDASGNVWSWGLNGDVQDLEDYGRLGIGWGWLSTNRPKRVVLKNRVLNRNKQKWYVTIQSAVDKADSGDEIVVYEGTYREKVEIEYKDLVLRSSDPGNWDVVNQTIIDGTQNIAPGGPRNGIELTDSNSTIHGFTIADCSCGVYFKERSSPVIEGCIIYGSSWWGINIEYTDDSVQPVIRNNWIFDNKECGIYQGTSVYSPILVQNNTIVNNQYYGIFVAGSIEPDVRNCIIYNNGTNLYGISEVDYCCINDDPGGTGNITSDPCFVDAINGDYHVRGCSGCINAGDLNFYWDGNEPDIDGDPRVMLGRVDIGADEYTYLSVDAGPDQYISVLEDANLDGTISGAEQYTCLWSKLSGPGEVTFGNAYDLDTTASFGQMGTYTLRLSAYVNGDLAGWDTVDIRVNLSVDAGQGQTITLPTNSVRLDGSAPGADSVTWTHVVSGVPVYGIVDFNDPDILNPVATIYPGLYGTFTLKLTAYVDDEPAGSDTVTITVEPPGPVVFAGSDKEAVLTGTEVVVDLNDAWVYCYTPGQIESTVWSLQSGPNDLVIFGDVNEVDTTATFYEDGEYWLKLEARDANAVVGSDTVRITVQKHNGPPRVNPGAVETGIINQAVILDDAQVWDDNDVAELTLKWELLYPAGGNAAFNPAWNGDANFSSALNPEVTFDTPGGYTLKLTATDAENLSDSGTLTVFVGLSDQNGISIGAGSYQNVILPDYILALDDAWIIPGLTEQMTVEWSVVGTPDGGYAAFADVNDWTDSNKYSSTSSDFVPLVSFSPTGDGSGVVTGDYVFRLKITDTKAGEFTSEAVVTVETADTSAPEITAFYVTQNGHSIEDQQDVLGWIDIFAIVQDRSMKIDSLKLLIDDSNLYDFDVDILEGVPGDIHKLQLTHRIHTYHVGPGDHNLVIEAWDSRGNGPTIETISFNIGSGGSGTPIARITGWTDDSNSHLFSKNQNEPASIIDKGLVELFGAAYLPDSSSNAIEYKIELFKQGIENYAMDCWAPGYECYDDYIVANVTPDANSDGWRFVDTEILDGGSLGQVDLTGVENGYYQMLLTVRYQNLFVARANVGFVLDCPLKLGNVRFSQEDTVIPIGGLPIRIVRTYDSFRRKNKGAFGYGWSYSIADMEIQLDETRAERELWGGGHECVRNSSNFSRDVTLTLPDGRRATFQFYLEPRSPSAKTLHIARYKSPPGVNATLQVWLGDETWPIKELRYPNEYGLWEPQDGALGQRYEAFYEFPGFILTAEDGTKYFIKRKSYGEYLFVYWESTLPLLIEPRGEPYLSKIVTADGETIEFDVVGDDLRIEGIVHKDVNDIPTKQLKIVYDGDLVSEIYPPSELYDGEPITGAVPVLKYDYDGAGDLVEVHRLVDRDSKTYETTTFVYDEHYITSIVDSRGLTPIQYVYDDAGRLQKVIGAKGSEILLDPNLAGNTQTVTDRLGNVTVYSYNGRGNITGITDANGNTTYYEYNDGNNPDSATKVKVPLVKEPSEEEDYAITLTAYDDKGRTTSTTGPVGNVTQYDYDDLGNVTNTRQYRPGPNEPVLVSQTVNTYKSNTNLLLTTEVKDESGYTVDRTDYLYNNKNYVEHVIRRYNPDIADDNNFDIITTYLYNQDQSYSPDQPYSISEPYYRYQEEQSQAPVYLRFFEYDDNGNQVLTRENWKDPKGQDPNLYVFTVNDYDAQGRVVKTRRLIDDDSDPANPISETILSETYYNGIGKAGTTWDELGNYTQYDYDELGNLVETRTYDSNGTHLTASQNLYDAEGRVIVTAGPYDPCEPNNVGTETVYDALGRVVETRRWSNVQIDLVDLIVNNEYVGRTVNPDADVANAWDGTGDEPDNIGWTTDGVVPQVGSDYELSYNTTQYDAAGRVEATISLDEQADEHITEYGYDNAGRQITVTDANGNTTLTHYLGNRRDYVVDARGTIGGVDPNDYKTSFEYDALGRIIKTTHPPTEFEGSGGVAQNTYSHVGYDNLGRKLWQSDIVAQADAVDVPESEKRYFEYDAAGRLVATILPEPQAGAGVPRYDYFYDDYGNMAGILDPLGRLTVFEYDEHGRQTVKYMPFTAADANVIYSAVDVYAELAATSPQPKCETSEYDDFGRLVKTTDCKGQVTGYFYDNQGRLEFQRFYGSDSFYPNDPNETVQYIYDNLGQKTQVDVTDFDSSTVSTYGYDYDDQSRVVEVNTPQGTIGYGYNDITSSMESVCTPSSGIIESKISYGYDELGRLKTVTVNKRNGQSVAETSNYQYSPVGSRETLQYANNNYAEYQYDALNRLTSLTNWQDDNKSTALSSFQYTLQADGMRTKVVETVDETRTIEYDYDNLNRLVQEYGYKASDEYTVDYTYDLAGNRTQRVVTVDNTTVGHQELTTVYTYDPNTDRLLTEVHTGPELVGFYWNDKQIYAHAGGGSISMYHIAGQDGDIGSLRAWLLGMPTKWSQYLFRLVAFLLPLVFLSPLCARIGRRLRGGENKNGPRPKPLLHRGLCILMAYIMFISPETFYQLSQADISFSELATTDWANGNRTITYTYDDNGSVTSKVTKETDTEDLVETVNYTYNLQNRLARVETIDHIAATTTVVAYKYNPDGIRTAKIEDPDGEAVTITYLIDAYNHTGYAQTFIEDDGADATCYIIGDDVLAQAVNSDNPQYLLSDGHGSVRQLANNSGTVITGQNFAYDSYGILLGEHSPQTNLLYTGECLDESAGLYYNRARWYDPTIGRFNRTDPWSGSTHDPQSLHKYLYCHANPVNATDPSGMMTITEVCVTIGIILLAMAGIHSIAHRGKYILREERERIEGTEAITLLNPGLKEQMYRDAVETANPEVLKFNMEFWHEHAEMNKAITLYNLKTKQTLLEAIDTSYHGLEVTEIGLGTASALASCPIFWSEPHGSPPHWDAMSKFAMKASKSQPKPKAIYTHHSLGTITNHRVSSRLLPDVAEVMPSGKLRITQFLYSEGPKSAAKKEEQFRAALGSLLESYRKIDVP